MSSLECVRMYVYVYKLTSQRQFRNQTFSAKSFVSLSLYSVIRVSRHEVPNCQLIR